MTALRQTRRRSADAVTLLCIYVCVLLIIPPTLVVRGLPMSLSPSAVLAIGIFLFWFCAQLTMTLGAAKGHSPVRAAMFCYAVALLASYGYATYQYLPPDELGLSDHSMVLAVAYLGVALGTCDGVRDRERLDVLLKTVVVAATVIASIGALQFLFNIDLAAYVKPPGLREAMSYDFITDRSNLRRAGSTTGHPIEFGVLCAMTLPLAAHYGFTARERGEPATRWWVCAVLIGSGILFSLSRSAMIGCAGAAIVLLLGWRGRRRLQALLVTGGFFAVAYVAVPGLLGTLYGLFSHLGTDTSVQYRAHDYELLSTQVASQLWLGRGLGTWYAPKHQILDNQFVLTLIETGVIGLVAYVGVFAAALYAALRARAISTDPGQRNLGLTLSACLVVPVLGSATFDLLSFRAAAGVAFVLVGAAGALLRTALNERAARSAPAVWNGSATAPATTILPSGPAHSSR
jgi:O-antigen ligase